MPGGYTDWVAAAAASSCDNLKALGFDVAAGDARPRPTYESDRAVGSYDMLFGVHGGSCNMFRNFSEPLGSDQTRADRQEGGEQLRPLERPGDRQAARPAAARHRRGAQKKAVAGLANIMMDQVPMIPIWYGAKWFQYRPTRRSAGRTRRTRTPRRQDNLLVLTHLEPAGS